ncbi:MAG: PilZ domain-containing protein [Acidimicrobiales bacterium]|nr:PilZ domain-containing protein [Acidimicrobiales bacterium]
MMAYRAVADTVRSTILAEGGREMVAQLRDLRDIVTQDVFGAGPASTDARGRQAVPVATPAQFRRRVPRRATDWQATCCLEGESARAWWECRVLDISMRGVAIVFSASSPLPLVGRHILVDVPAGEANVRLEGEIKNATVSGTASTRVGIAFDPDAATESEPAAGEPFFTDG